MDDATRQWLLDQVGSTTDTALLDARYALLGSARAVALSILRQRHADYLKDQPASITVSSVVGINMTENIKALERKIAELESGQYPAPDEPTTPGQGVYGFGVIRLRERRRR